MTADEIRRHGFESLPEGGYSEESVNAFVDEIAKRGLKNVTVAQTGCIGMCQYEPIVEVFAPGAEKVTYVKINAENVPEIVANHIVNGNPVTELTVGAIVKD